MLELDLDMEADLGIDTVKQAELFGRHPRALQDPRKDNLSLKDYPTIKHCIRFVLDATAVAIDNRESAIGNQGANCDGARA